MGWADEFAEGFAAGFVPAYEASTARAEKQRQAEFEAALERRKELEERMREERKKIETAEDIASALGIEGTDAVLEALNLYGSAPEVINAYQEGQITFGNTVGNNQGDVGTQTENAFSSVTRNDIIQSSDGPTVEAGEALSALDEDALSSSMDFLRQQEGFREEAYFDVNANRAGYGSDTVTREDGTVAQVTEGTRVSREDAEKDLERRVRDEFMPSVRDAVGPEAFNNLTSAQKTALTSLAYNYGANAWEGRLSGVAEAVRRGDNSAVSQAITQLRNDNDGINAARREREAALFASSGSISPMDQQMADSGLGSTAPTAGTSQSGFRIVGGPDQLSLNELPDLEMIRDSERWSAARDELDAIIASEGQDAVPSGYMRAFENRRSTIEQMEANSTAREYLDGVGTVGEAQVALRAAQADGASRAVISTIEATLGDLQDSAFEPPETPEEARNRYNAALRSGNDAERERLLPFVDQGQGDFAKLRFIPRDGGVGQVKSVEMRISPETGETEYYDLQNNRVNTEDFVVAPITEDMIEDSNSVNSALGKEIRDYNSQRRAILGLGDLAFEMSQILEANPEAGTRVAGIVSGVRTTSREVATAGNILRDFFAENDELTETEANRILQSNGFLEEGETLADAANRYELEDFISEDLADLGAARKALEAKMLLTIFRVGGIEGQSGRSMSDKTFQHFENFIRAARTPERFRENMSSYLRNVTSQVNQQRDDIINSPQARNFIRNYDYNPVEITPLQDVINNNENYRRAFEYFAPGYSTAEVDSATGQNTPAPTPDPASSGSSSMGRLVTPEMVQQTPSLSAYEGQRIRAVRSEDGQITIEVVE